MGDLQNDADMDVRLIALDVDSPYDPGYLQYKIGTDGYKRLVVDIGDAVVDAIVTANEPFMHVDYNDVVLSSAGVLIFDAATDMSISSGGELDMILIKFEDQNSDVELIIDGVSRYKVNLKDWSDNIGASVVTYGMVYGMPIIDSKTWIDSWTQPIRFDSNIQIKGYNSTGKSAIAHVVKLREKT